MLRIVLLRRCCMLQKVRSVPPTTAASAADPRAPALGEAAPAEDQHSDSSEPEQQLQQAGKPESGATEPASSEQSEATAWRTNACEAEADEPWQAGPLAMALPDDLAGSEHACMHSRGGSCHTLSEQAHFGDSICQQGF